MDGVGWDVADKADTYVVDMRRQKLPAKSAYSATTSLLHLLSKLQATTKLYWLLLKVFCVESNLLIEKRSQNPSAV